MSAQVDREARTAPARPHRAWIAVALLALAAHAPALAGGYVWDDIAIAGHPVLADLDGLARIWVEPGAVEGEVHYWPLTYTSLWLDQRLFGVGPFGHHLGNWLLHALNSVLVWLVLTRLALPGAWLGAALFAVHPVHVESVAWVVERKDLLASAFYGLACLAWIRWDEPQRRWGWYVGALLLYGAALLSKTMALGLPLALGLFQWARRGRLTGRDVLALTPFALVGGALAAFDVAFTRQADPFSLGLSALERLLVSTHAFWFYLEKLAWPVELVPIHPRFEVDLGAPLAWLAVLATLVLFAGTFLARARLGRWPFVAASFFLVALAPTLGWIDFHFLGYSFVADRFQYLASAAPLALAAAAWTHVRANERVRIAIAGAVLALLAVASARQTLYFANDERLFGRTVAVNPRAWPAWVNYGLALLERGDARAALPCLERAVELAPESARTRSSLGTVLHALGRFDEAVARQREALALDPRLALAEERLGLALERAGRADEARQAYRRALELAPDSHVARFNLGMALAQAGELAAAERELAELVSRAPAEAEFRAALAQVLASRGELERARTELVEALRLRPDLAAARALLDRVEARLGRQETR